MALHLRKDDTRPFAPERVTYFEALRKTRVPRYLFRAFSSNSGGGQHLAINNETEIIPHGLMNGKKLDFYSKSEANLYALARAHLFGRKYPLTQCSSWAASLHAVLCYAVFLLRRQCDVWIAAIDTEQLPDVFVFYVSDLVGHADLEYQAYGHIHGPGFKAVHLEDMHKHGLRDLFPEVYNHIVPYGAQMFGYQLRSNMFQQQVIDKVVSRKEAHSAVAIASLFGKLAAPVAAALLCLRPRPWLTGQYVVEDSEVDVHTLLDPMGLPATTLSHTDLWLQPGVVDIGAFVTQTDDVRQWIVLMKSFTKHLAMLSLREYGAKRKRGMVGETIDGETEKKDCDDLLRPRAKKCRVENLNSKS